MAGPVQSFLGDKPFPHSFVGDKPSPYSSLGDIPFTHRRNPFPRPTIRPGPLHIPAATPEPEPEPPLSTEIGAPLTHHPHASGETDQLTVTGQPIIIACKTWRQMLLSKNQREDIAGQPADDPTAAISKLQILSEKDTNGSQLNVGAPAVPGGQEDNDLACCTVDAKQLTSSLGDGTSDTPSTLPGPQGRNIKPRLWALPDPDYRAIKSWDSPPPDNQARKHYDNLSPDYRAIKSWDNPPKVSDNDEKPNKPQVSFAIPHAKPGLQPNTIMGTSPPLAPPETTAPLRTKPTTQVPANIPSTANQSLIAPNSKDVKTAGSYIIPAAFDPFKYGRPSTTRAESTANFDVGYSRPIYGCFPDAKKRIISKEPRTIVIKNLPGNPTLAMVSLVCKGTGKIESITLFESLKKARVVFVHSADAEKFFNENKCQLSLEYKSGGRTIQHMVTVEMKYNTNFLSAPTHTLVTKMKATRVVRVVGWSREGLEYLVDSSEDENEPLEVLLVRLAGLYAYTGVEDRVEGATWRKNEKGLMEANLIYSRIKDAYCAIGALGKEIELSQCIVTYGKDPCEA
ncbi:hypothetical protein Q9L58_004934 [Maublancomyces gigas]|uniref:Uncharacterized protein n=1 Tax=Discina gigas TaxID=1032678 RepID=A0ABR3GK29_9PEZI